MFYDNEFGEITQNKGHYAVEDHSRSPTLEQIDFLLVININVPPILHRFRDVAFNRSKIAKFRYPLIAFNSCRWSGSLHHITGSDISLKLHVLGYILVPESLGISSTTFTHCAAKATEFGEITQNKGHYPVQGHSRSQIWYQSKAHAQLPISD